MGVRRMIAAVDELRESGAAIDNWTAVIACRNHGVPLADEGAFTEYPVVAVEVDLSESEVNLEGDPTGSAPALSVSGLLALIDPEVPGDLDCNLFVNLGITEPDDDERGWGYRMDVPVVAFGSDDEQRTFALLMEYDGWRGEIG